jgi:hypothetical protein
MAGKLPMGQKKLLRGKAIELVKRKKLAIRVAALSCDKKNVFVLTGNPRILNYWQGYPRGTAMVRRGWDKSGRVVILRNHPQAKGSDWGNQGFDQDRLVKELRLAGILTLEEATRCLLAMYLSKMNEPCFLLRS